MACSNQQGDVWRGKDFASWDSIGCLCEYRAWQRGVEWRNEVQLARGDTPTRSRCKRTARAGTLVDEAAWGGWREDAGFVNAGIWHLVGCMPV